MKKIAWLGALLLILMTVATACGSGCSDPIGCVEIAPDEPVRIAYLLVTSGSLANIGADSLGGIEIALTDRTEIKGHAIELVGHDSMCSAEGGESAALAVADDDKVVGVIGTTCSSAATAAIPIISQAGLAMISSSNTAPELTDADASWQAGYYRVAHNDLFQGRISAQFVYNELGARTVATIHDNTPYTNQLQQVFADTFEELGGNVVAREAINVGDADMTAVLTRIASNSPDVLYAPIFEPEINLTVMQVQEIPGLENTILMGADSALTSKFAPETGEAAIGMYLSGPFISGPAYDEFLSKWEAQIGGVPPSGFHAFAYDGTNILLDAIELVAEEGSDGSLLIGRQALRDAITGTSGFDGLSGNLSCGATGDCATGEALAIFKISPAEVDGNFPPEMIWTLGS